MECFIKRFKGRISFLVAILLVFQLLVPLTTLAADTQKPEVYINSPGSGDTFTKGDPVYISASGSDNDRMNGLQLYIGGSPVGDRSYGNNVSYEWDTGNATAKSHTIKVSGVDLSGNPNEKSITVTVKAVDTPDPSVGPDTPVVEPPKTVVDNEKPVIRNLRPNDGVTFTQGSIVTISADISDNGTLNGTRIYIDGDPVGERTNRKHISYDWDTKDASATSHSIKINATDTAKNLRTEIITVNIVPRNPKKPEISISTPGEGQIFTQGETVAIYATASSKDGMDGMQIYIDGKPYGNKSYEAEVSYNWKTTDVKPGSHTIKVNAFDASVGITPATITVNIIGKPDGKKPVIAINRPADGDMVAQGKAVDIYATAWDKDGINGMRIYIDGQPVGERSTGDSVSYKWDTKGALLRTHTIKVTAADQSGDWDSKSIDVNVVPEGVVSKGNTEFTTLGHAIVYRHKFKETAAVTCQTG